MEEQTTQGIDLSVFLHNFRRTLQHFFWVPIVLGLLLGGVSWLRAARSYAPVYQSSAVFSVSAGFSSSTDILSHSTYLDSNAAAQLSATFPYVLQSDRMQLLLQQELGDQRAPVSLSASSVADAALFTLTATGSDPQAVYDTLLAAIEVYPAAATTILGDTQIQVIDQPVEPSAAPINANTALQTGIRRGVVGLVLGLVLVALLSLTRRTVHSAEDLHRLISLSCLSSIPAVRRGKRTRREAPSLLLTHAGTGSDFSEAMRNLSLKLQRITSKHGAKVVLITSTVPGEGKTTVASNLALALAAEGKRVILIDGDLRKQSLKPLFGIGAHSDGLVEVLSGKAKNFRLLPFRIPACCCSPATALSPSRSACSARRAWARFWSCCGRSSTTSSSIRRLQAFCPTLQRWPNMPTALFTSCGRIWQTPSRSSTPSSRSPAPCRCMAAY